MERGGSSESTNHFQGGTHPIGAPSQLAEPGFKAVLEGQKYDGRSHTEGTMF